MDATWLPYAMELYEMRVGKVVCLATHDDDDGCNGDGMTNFQAYLCWSMYCAAWICFGVPVMVMMRSVEPGRASSIWMKAFDSERMRRMRPPPLPMMAPASWKKAKRDKTAQQTEPL